MGSVRCEGSDSAGRHAPRCVDNDLVVVGGLGGQRGESQAHLGTAG